MRILDAVVLPPTALMAGAYPKIMGGGAIRAQIIRDQSIGDEPAFLQEFAHQFQRGMLVSLGLDQHVEDLALSIDGAPQIDHAEAFAIPERQRDAVAECIEKIVLAVTASVVNTKALDLIEQVIS